MKPRLAGLIFGVVDYAGNIGARDAVREQFALYHYPKAKTVAAARAAGIDVVDGVTLQFRDLQQCEHDARSAAQMGFDGKWAIIPIRCRSSTGLSFLLRKKLRGQKKSLTFTNTLTSIPV